MLLISIQTIQEENETEAITKKYKRKILNARTKRFPNMVD